MDYSINPRQTISAQYAHNISDRKINQSYQSAFIHKPAEVMDSIIRSEVATHEHAPRDVGGIYYEWRIDSTGKKLNMDLDYFRRSADLNRDFTTQSFGNGTAAGPVTFNRTANKEDNSIGSLKADLVLPTKTCSFTVGAKALFIRNAGDYSYGRLDNGIYINDTLQSDHFAYTEHTQALYGSAQKEWGKWQLQAGLRMEATQTTGTSGIAGRLFSNDYIRFSPSAYIRYSPVDDRVWILSYNRRIERPQFSSMNPFRRYIIANSYEAGNPYLQPSLCHDIELNFTYKSSCAVSVFCQYISNYIGAAPVVDTAAHTFINTSANIGSVVYYGINLSVSKAFIKQWEVMLQLHGNYQEVNAGFYQAHGIYARPFCSLELVNSFVLNKQKTLLAELGFNAGSDQVYGVSIRKAYYELYGGLKYLCFDKRLSLSANVTDILRTSRFWLVNIYNGALEDDYYDGRGLFISASWKFGRSAARGKRADSRQEDFQRAE